jgi:energy-coupling factor transporter ATP-binding protein EcfA2
MYYRLVKQGFNSRGTLVPVGVEYDAIKDPTKDYYLSMYYYNEEQYKTFKEHNSVSGIVDVVTPFLVFDMDSEEDLEAARKDTVQLVNRLLTHGFKDDQITVCFSGKKGFSVEIFTNKLLSPEEFKSITSTLSEGLNTRDTAIVNPSRIIRVPLTKHQDTGLYKLPLNFNNLTELPIESIKELAQSTSNAAPWLMNEAIIPDAVLAMAGEGEAKQEVPLTITEINDIDYNKKPKDMPACKYSILNGFFQKGHRNDSLMALAAHFKARGFPQEATYNVLKAAARLQGQRYPEQEPIKKEEIWNTIIKSVYGPLWQGKTYSCSSHAWLKAVCPKGKHSCDNKYGKTKEIITISEVSNTFKSYAEDIDKNTILTGIPEIDKNVRLQTKSHVVIAGCSGSGKSTLMLNILKHASKNDQVTLFGSHDMSDVITFQKIAQSVTGLNDKELFRRYKLEPNFRAEVDLRVMQEYKNVLFDFSGGVTIDQLYERLYKAKIEHGSKLRLAVYDYINLISGPYSDANANLAYIAPKLKDLANELDVLVISLAQIGRDKGGPAAPLRDSRVAKGSSAIEESATVLFGLWREFYNTEHDNYVTIAALKTRMGKEFKQDLHWNGLTGEIRGLSKEEAEKLKELRDDKEMDEGGGPKGFGSGVAKVKMKYKDLF